MRARKVLVLGVLTALFFLSSCGTNSLPSQKSDSNGYTSMATGQLVEVTSFGTNPGSIKMFKYVPQNMPSEPRPMVLALHGCTQSASQYHSNSGWSELADKYKFYVLYPEQNDKNNGNLCFNWGGDSNTELSNMDPAGTIRRDASYTWAGKNIASNPGDESGSMMQMIDKMKNDHQIDNGKVFVTGLSAGGYFTVMMAAVYPDVFAAAAPMAGGPYLCNRSDDGKLDSNLAYSCMSPGRKVSWSDTTKDITPPSELGDLVRNFSGYTKPANVKWPRMQIWQGASDSMVKPRNAADIAEQWLNINTGWSIDISDKDFGKNADVVSDIKGHPYYKFMSNGQSIVEIVYVNGMGHGIAVDPGTAEDQGGQIGAWVNDANIHSSYYAWKFFEQTVVNQDTAPVVEIVSPAANAAAGTLSFKAEASDDKGVAKVELFINDVKVAEKTSAPYEYSWNAANGTYALKAVATDTAGQTSEAQKTVVIGEVVDSAPVVSLTAPLNGASFQAGNVVISAAASDDKGVAKVEIFINNNLAATLTSAPYNYTFNASAGSYVIKAKATDTIGQSTESAAASITVTSGGGNVFEPGTPECVSAGTFGVFSTQKCYAKESMAGKTAVPRALVVVHHGWTQTQQDVMDGTKWADLGAKYGFYVVFAQKSGNASQMWYDSGRSRGQSEPKAIISIIDKMKADHNIDASKIFTTGLSAGGYFTVNLISDYPDVFAGGASFAGGPHGCTTACMTSDATKSSSLIINELPSWWNDASKRKPRMIVWHGSSDAVVAYGSNFTQLRNQLAGAYGIDTNPDNNGSKLNNSAHTYAEFKNAAGELMLATVSIDGMGHAVNVDPGTGEDQGGAAVGQYAKDYNIYGPYYSAKFWGILNSGPVDNPPVVAITSPANGATVTGNVSVAVSASDDKGIVKVECFVDGALFQTDTTAPYSCAWNSDAAAYGNHVLSAKAYDTASQVTETSITVIGGGVVVPLSVNITSPANGAELSGVQTITASAQGGKGVAKVEFYVNNIKISEDSSAPYSASLDMASYTSGSFLNLKAVAIDNEGTSAVDNDTQIKVAAFVCQSFTATNIAHVAAGRAETYTQYTISYAKTIGAGNDLGQLGTQYYSATTTVSESQPGYFIKGACPVSGDTEAPVVSITSPSNGATVSGSVSITTSASDNVGVSKVELYLNGALIGTKDAAPYTFSWSATTGSHTLQAKAYDAAGNVGSSGVVSVTVGGGTFVCKNYNTTNMEHVAAGRAVAYTQWYNQYAKTVGSGESLGLLGTSYYSTKTAVRETAAGYFEKGVCP